MVAAIDVLEQAVRSGQGTLSSDLARYVLTLDFPEKLKDRCEELSEKAQAGSLTATETEELDAFISADAFLTMLKAKATRSLDGGEMTAR